MKNNLLRLSSHFPRINSDLDSIFLITTVWTGMVVLVNPIGNFPLNDDWAYGWTVKTFLETGEYRLSDWTATNLLPQAMFGTLFCLPFGFSFTALRISTLTLGLLGVLATYGLLREVKANPKLALLGALIVALNPIYFGLSNSFMSDVPSFTFAILSLYFIVRGLRLNSNLEILVGILISFISILNRQSGIVILLAFGLAFLAKKGIKISTAIIAFFPTLIGLSLQLAYSYWLEYTDNTPILYGQQIRHLQETFSGGFLNVISTYIENGAIIVAYLGLFLFPFLAVCFDDRLRSLSFKEGLFSFLLLLVTVAIMWIDFVYIKKMQMPFVGNILETFGLGPVSFDAYSSTLSSGIQISVYRVWRLLTLIAFAGATLLLLCCILTFLEILDLNLKGKNKSDRRWLLILIASSALAYFGLIGGLDKQYWFDRYLIFLFPIFMMLAAVFTPNALDNKPTTSLIASVMVILLIYGGFSIGATHDYLSWNRVRWQALNNLMENTKISPRQIYGGFEFNGWYFGNQLKTCNPNYQSQVKSTDLGWGTFDCLWGNDAETYRYIYTLGFINKPGYIIERQYSFKRWLPWRDQDLYVLKRTW